MFAAQTVIAFAVPIVCLILLIDCLRTKRLLPLFDSTRLARWTWCIAILLVNPVLLVAYFAVARKQWITFQRAALRDGVIVAAVVLGACLQFLPMGPSYQSTAWKMEGVDQEIAARWAVTLGASESRTAANTSLSSRPGGLPVPARHIRIVAHRDPLSWAIGESVAELLTAEPFTETVQLIAAGAPALAEAHQVADIYVNIDASDVSSLPLPFFNYFTGDVSLSMQSAPNHVGAFASGDWRLDQNALDFDGNLSLTFARVGSALGAAYFGGPAKVVADWLEGSCLVDLREKVSGGGLTPLLAAADAAQIPALDRDPATGFPTIVSNRKNALRTESTSGQFLHHREAYVFEDARSANDVLEELKAEMEALGWTDIRFREEERERSYLRGEKGGARLTASRWPMPKWMSTTIYRTSTNSLGETSSSEIPINRTHNDPGKVETFAITINFPFSDDELVGLGDTLAARPSAVNALDGMLLIQRSLSNEAEASLLATLRKTVTPSASRWLTLARLEAEAGNNEAGVRALKIVRALDTVTDSIDLHSRIDSLVKKHELDLENSTSRSIDFERLSAAGFPTIDEGNPPATASLALGESVRILGKDLGGTPFLLTLLLTAIEPQPVLQSTHRQENWWSVEEYELDGSMGTSVDADPFKIEHKIVGERVELRIGALD